MIGGTRRPARPTPMSPPVDVVPRQQPLRCGHGKAWRLRRDEAPQIPRQVQTVECLPMVAVIDEPHIPSFEMDVLGYE